MTPARDLGDVLAAGFTLKAYTEFLAHAYGEHIATGKPLAAAEAGRKHARIMAGLFGGEAHTYADAAAAAWKRASGAANSPAPTIMEKVLEIA